MNVEVLPVPLLGVVIDRICEVVEVEAVLLDKSLDFCEEGPELEPMLVCVCVN